METNQVKDDLDVIKKILFKTSKTFSKTYPFFFIIALISVLKIILTILSNHISWDIINSGSIEEVSKKIPVINNVTMIIDVLLILLFIFFYFKFKKKFQSDIHSLSLILINIWGIFFIVNQLLLYINKIIIWKNVLSYTKETNALLVYNYSRYMYTNSINSILFGGGLFVTGLLIHKKTPKLLALIMFVINTILLVYKPNLTSLNVNQFSQYLFTAEIINHIITTVIMLIFAVTLLIYNRREEKD